MYSNTPYPIHVAPFAEYLILWHVQLYSVNTATTSTIYFNLLIVLVGRWYDYFQFIMVLRSLWASRGVIMNTLTRCKRFPFSIYQLWWLLITRSYLAYVKMRTKLSSRVASRILYGPSVKSIIWVIPHSFHAYTNTEPPYDSSRTTDFMTCNWPCFFFHPT